MKSLTTSFIILYLLTYNGNAQTKLSLSSAKKILESNSTAIKQSQLQTQISNIELDQAYDNLIPNLGFSMNSQNIMGLNFDQITGQLITGNQWTHAANANLTSSLTVFQGFRDLNTIKWSKLNTELSKLDVERVIYELQIQLINLYFQTLINYDLYQASRAQAEISRQMVSTEEAKIETGKSTILDLAQAKTKLADDELNITNAKNAYHLCILRLKQLLELDDEIELIKPTRGMHQGLDFSSTADSISIDDPYLKIINKRIDQSIVSTRLAKSSYYPTVNFSAGYGTNYSSQRILSVYSSSRMPLLDQMNSSRSLYLNLSLSYSIFDKNSTRSNVNKAKISTENLKLEREKIVRDRKQNLNQLKLEHNAAVGELSATESSYNSSKMNYEAMRERYLVGKNSSIELFNAMTHLNMQEFKKIACIYNIYLKEQLIILHSDQL